ncbi:hypothetical protein BASA81_007308 [Batrachochytrium salamandrivorans]|nr:hypothetical protein BASA81_007308 [Batrachochytrium salamandrivorans]
MLCNTKVGFPVFDSVESQFDSNEFILCGGGGSARSGVFNRVLRCTLGPRPDGIPGVSLVTLNSYDTGSQIATSCCFLSPTEICFALDKELVVCSASSSSSADEGGGYVERNRVVVGELVEVVRSFNSQLFVGTELGSLVVYDLGLQVLYHTRLHFKPVVDLTFTPAFCASCSADGTIRIWDLQNHMTTAAILPAREGMTFREAKFLPGNRLLALQVPKSRKGSCFASMFARRTSNSGGEFVLDQMHAVSPSLATGLAANQRFVAVGSADATTLFHTETFAPVNQANKVHGLPVTGLFFRGGHLVSTSADATAAMISVDLFASPARTGLGWLRMCLTVLVSLVLFVGGLLLIVLVAKGADGTQPKLALDVSLPIDLHRVTTQQLQVAIHNLMLTLT